MPRITVVRSLFLLTVLAAVIAAIVHYRGSFDGELRRLIDQQNITMIDPGLAASPEMVALGEALFFDKVLSGNRDISCATCHHPTLGSGDELVVSIGTGATGLGPERRKGEERDFIPRNAPEVFNRGAAEWRTMFWDSRVSAGIDGVFDSPAGERLPPGLDNVLAVQAMFPVTSRDEMRGDSGDLDRYGNPNELALLRDDDLEAIWDGLMKRLLSSPSYVSLFRAAYPELPAGELGFQHAANAISAFEASKFALANSPWANYLDGDDEALSGEAKRGALLFFGRARCSQCHSAPLFSDQEHHVLAVPQVGPGKGKEAPLDFGRMRETGLEAERYAFRTPPLHNVAVSGPWMHDGAFSTLEAVIRHHMDPTTSLRSYDPAEHLPAQFRETYQVVDRLEGEMLAHLDPLLRQPIRLTDAEIDYLIAFLEALTDPACLDMSSFVPEEVPSGIPVADEIAFGRVP